MKILTQTVLKDLSGKEILDENKKGFTLGQALGNICVSSKEEGKMKLYILGTKLFQDKDVEVDDADLNLLKNVVKKTEVYEALIAGQCELLLDEVKK